MINDKGFRNKVLTEIFLHPMVLVPFCVGIASLCFSFEGPRHFRMLAAAGIFISGVALIGRMTFWFDSIVQKTFTKWHKKQEWARNKALDQLDKSLSADQDTRDERILRQLRSVYKVFVEMVASAKIRQYDFLNTAERLFVNSIENLRESQEKWRQAMELPVESREILLEERKRLIDDVEVSVGSLSGALEEIQKLTHKKSELSNIRKELEQRLELAKKVEKRLGELSFDGDLDKLEFNNGELPHIGER